MYRNRNVHALGNKNIWVCPSKSWLKWIAPAYFFKGHFSVLKSILVWAINYMHKLSELLFVVEIDMTTFKFSIILEIMYSLFLFFFCFLFCSFTFLPFVLLIFSPWNFLSKALKWGQGRWVAAMRGVCGLKWGIRAHTSVVPWNVEAQRV